MNTGRPIDEGALLFIREYFKETKNLRRTKN